MPLLIVDPFARVDSATTTNSYGIDRNFDLGVAQIWNVDMQRDLPRNLTVNLGYTGTRGSHLDMQRAPNRNPDGSLRIEGVQPFLWESSEGRSTLHSFSLRARKRLSRGVSFGGGYTMSRAYDNASSFGSGGGTVAQNDQDLAAEWGRSSFERRHAANLDYTIELPWGPGRPWLNNTRLLAQLVGGWSWSGNLVLQSGAPLTARVTGSFVDVGSGVNGTLRANYDGSDISIGDPTSLRFFNTDAFSIPFVGALRQRAAQPDHRPGLAQLEHEPVEERQLHPHPRRDDSRPGQQRTERYPVRGDRHRRQLADVRSGDERAADAIGAGAVAVPVLTLSNHGACGAITMNTTTTMTTKTEPLTNIHRARRGHRDHSKGGPCTTPAAPSR